MELVNTSLCGNPGCYCMNFVQDLLNLCKEVLATEGELQQWTVFQTFRREFLDNYRFKIVPGSFIMCSALLCEIGKFERKDLALSVLLVDLLTVIYSKYNGKIFSNLIEDVKKLPILNDADTARVLTALRTKSDFMKMLVNFGYLSSLREESLLLQLETYRLIGFIIWSVNRSAHAFSESYEVVKLLKKSIFHSKEESEIFKRLYLIGCALHAVQQSLKNKHVEAENLICCLNMYFSATPAPFLTAFEVRCVLYALFTVLNKLDLFNQYSEEFVKLMPECPAKTEPRTLAHLARCLVRQNLEASTLPLPAAADKLGLPRILKSFILGDVMNFSRKSANVSS